MVTNKKEHQKSTLNKTVWLSEMLQILRSLEHSLYFIAIFNCLSLFGVAKILQGNSIAWENYARDRKLENIFYKFGFFLSLQIFDEMEIGMII